ncbi:MAG: cation diffusion facilitator family transporter [Candidatus Thorarchaeota archaeon]
MSCRGEVSRAAGISVIVAVILTIIKIIAGILTNSLGVISEALHSGLDLVAAAITFIAVNRASKSPDRKHHYGHGKIENFAALAETLLLWITSAWIVSEAWTRIVHQDWPQASLFGVGVMIVSILVNYERSKMLYRVADQHKSQALEADALHFYADMISSIVVLVGLGFVWVGYPIGDPISAIGVAAVIFIASIRLGREAYNILIDSAPDGIEEELYRIVENTPGVFSCDKIRVRHSGPFLFIDMTIRISPELSINHAHDITLKIEEDISSLAENVDCVVHVEPIEQVAVKN